MKRELASWRFPVLYILTPLIIAGVLLLIQSFTEEGNENKTTVERTPALSQDFEIPESLNFAGEPVPLDNYDTRESLDRELLVNGYWHSRTLLVLKKSHRYFAVIEPILKKYNVPDDFKFLVMAESGFDYVVSPAKAAGFWQLLENTAREYGLEVNTDIDERYNLEKSTEAACKFLLESYKAYGNWTMAAATYNAGRKGLDTQIVKQKTNNYYDLLLNDETARYVFRILAHKLIYENPDQYGFHLDEGDFYPLIPSYDVAVDSSISNLTDFALDYSINYKILKQFNPWLRQNYLPNKENKTYYIKIPENLQRNILQTSKLNKTTSQN